MTDAFDQLMSGLDEVESFLAGETAGFRVQVPAEVNVKEIRTGLGMTQARFSDAFGFSLDAVKHWEGGRRTPESSARAYLTVIARNPGAVIDALRSTKTGSTKKQSHSSSSGVRVRRRTTAASGNRRAG